MGDMFRSEKMVLAQMFLQPDAAYATVAELGEAGCVQFRDLNTEVNSFQKKFVGEVRRCEELERQMRYVEMECVKDEIKLPIVQDDIPNAPLARNLVDLEANMERIETELQECSRHAVNMRTNFQELNELRLVLENTDGFFSSQEVNNLDSMNRQPNAERGRLGFIAGVIRRERIFAFERMLWRISRGNVYLKRSDIEEILYDPLTGSKVYKTVFVVFFQGDQLQARIKKICQGFHASLYQCPSSHAERQDMVRGVLIRIEDLKMILAQTDDHRQRVLVTAAKDIPRWQIMVKKAKAIYHTLNMFNIDVTEKVMIGEGWIPKKDLPNVQQALIDGSAAAKSSVPSFINVLEPNEQPPTFNRTNKFTRGFQALIDAYGMATYREANPALYTCITFPFLFAVMFGDLGHGFLMFLFGFYLVLWEKKLSKLRGGEIWRIFFAGRYIIMLMGLFAMYTGFTYNDIFSKSINVFGSHWRIRYNTSTVLTNPNGLTIDPKYMLDGVYPWGMDPIWQSADNKIIFQNSYKMKLSIIIGVIHMIFGVCMSVENYVYFKRYSSIFLEYIPQVVFLCLLFGYLCVLMFWKWVEYSPTATEESLTPGCAPNVLILFINMMMFKDTPALKGCKSYLFPVEDKIQKIFVIVALICIPWMLLGKPIYIQLTRKYKKKQTDNHFIENASHGDHMPNGDVVVANLGDCYEDELEEEPMSEIYIHQCIHTIEYVLSTISHTASYLRLWALSLAHAELSEVLWTMVMKNGLAYKNFTGCIILYFIFWAWALLTIAIMLLMEGLSAFLHTLRLHWVEFMSKFYEGAGYAFMPFSFKHLLDEEEED